MAWSCYLHGHVEPELAAIEEVRGHFKIIEEVVYDDEGPRFVTEDEEEGDIGAVVEVREAEDPVPAVPAIRPSIQEEADVIPRALPVKPERRRGFFNLFR